MDSQQSLNRYLIARQEADAYHMAWKLIFYPQYQITMSIDMAQRVIRILDKLPRRLYSINA